MIECKRANGQIPARNGGLLRCSKAIDAVNKSLPNPRVYFERTGQVIFLSYYIAFN
jgi:hypothetical protein